MKRRAFSLLLSLTLLLSLALPATTAYAEDGSSNKGMEISKTATANQDGSYTITLEAYATGEKVISEVTEDVPTDIVLVLDQSGSMAENMTTYSFRKYTGKSNGNFYSLRHNGGSKNLYYLLDNGSYVTVSVTEQKTLGHIALGNLKNYTVKYSWSGVQLTTDCYYYYANNLYEKVGEEYKQVTLTETSSGYWWNPTYTYTYTFSDGTAVTSTGRNETPNLGSHGPLYYSGIDATKTVYTYTYTDKDGVTQTIGTSIGETMQPTEFTLYERYQSGSTRLEALKDAVTNFADAVAKKAAGADKTLGTDDDVNHRIAVVGFSSDDYSNTELLTGVQITTGNHNYGTDPVDTYISTYYYPTGYAKNGVQYGSITDEQYGNALQDMNTAAGKANVTDAFNALTAHGGTRTNDGMAMANEIFENTPIDAGKKRNRVVIVFTDGVPGLTDYDSDIAASAISEGNTAKKTYGATVYTVGIFSGADATSAGDENGTDTQKANWFMQKLSSNDGKVQTPSYYLSAADAGTLNNIFQQISNQIETGGSSSTLTSDAVVKDIISPQFTLPKGATTSSITLETYRCTGKNANGDYTWIKNADAMGATASISGDQVSVTGFNFSDNYVGTVTENGNTSYRGNKLVISFKVQPKAGFLGGNDVITNTNAGIYENGSAQTPVMTFDQPKVNVPIVPIQYVTVTATDKNVYLKGSVTTDQLKSDATVKVGDVSLDLTKDNYGLADWQTEYVNITVTITDKDGKTFNADDLTGLTEDKDFTVTVTVSPKTAGTTTPEKGNAATAKSGTDTKKINVFKPVLTFKDSTAYYGETVPTNNDFGGNKVSEVWKHDTTESTTVTMLGDKPALDITYTPDNSKIFDGKYGKADVPVKADVKIGGVDVNDYTTFEHQACDPACGWETPTKPGDPAFLIHINTCTLSITKQGGAADESYVFDVFKDEDGVKYSEVTVWGNSTETLVELPIGTYTIRENAGWSWRYTANNGSSAELTAQNPTGSITCGNTKNNNQWLNGFSEVVRNIFGTNH